MKHRCNTFRPCLNRHNHQLLLLTVATALLFMSELLWRRTTVWFSLNVKQRPVLSFLVCVCVFRGEMCVWFCDALCVTEL